MANNRIWLKCEVCEKKFYFGKRYAGGYSVAAGPLNKELQSFFDEHEFCKENPLLDIFVLEYESSRDVKND